MRNTLKAAIGATLMVSMPVTGAVAARPSASVPSAKPNAPAGAAAVGSAGAAAMTPLIVIGLLATLAAIIAVAAGSGKSDTPAASRG